MRPGDPRLRPLLVPARRPLAGVVGVGVLGSLAVLAQAWVVTGLVVATVRGDDRLPVWAVAVVGVLLLRGLLGWAGDAMAARAATTVGSVLRHRLLTAVLRRGRDESSGEVAVLLTRGVAATEPYVTRYLPALVLAALLPPLTVVAIATQDLLSAVIVLATLPLVPVFGALVGLATRDRAALQWRELGSLSGHFLDVVRGLPTLVAHRRARVQSARIAEVSDRYRVATLRTLRLAFASSAVLELVATLSVALVAVTVGVRLASGGLDLPTALLVLLLAPEAYWPLRRVGAEFHAAAEGTAAFEQALAVIDLDSGDAAAPVDAGAGFALVVDRVSLTHAGRSAPALAEVSMVVPSLGITAVTGPSGCGKTTLLSVLAGLLPPTTGRVMAPDGTVLAGPAWQQQVALLPQQPAFLAGSVADNLLIARPAASDADLWEALREVALEERVRALPAGLHTPLAEDGASLSAGERARLALARVLVADRPWVLLDEPTAHLDDLTEQVIADAVLALSRRAAVVVVAHRPALVALADRVVTLRAPQRAVAPTDVVPTATPAPVSPAVTEAPAVPHSRRLLPTATVIGALASASGVALTATAGWLIVQASTQPPVLTLLVAVVGVRAFGLARPVLRYVERLLSHDAALRELVHRRVEVYDALVPLTPARLGRRRGDALACVVDDVDAGLDRELRVLMPVRSAALVALIATVVTALLLPPAALVVAGFAVVAGGGGFLVARAASGRAERRVVALRAELSDAAVEAVQLADELRMWQADRAAADRVTLTGRRVGEARAVAARGAGLARALVLVSAGVAIAMTALLAATAVTAGELSSPVAALLVLLPLALADVALPLADAGALSVQTAAARARLDDLLDQEPAVPADGAARPTDPTLTLSAARARWTPEAPLTAAASLVLTPGDRVALVGPSGCGKSTIAALVMRFLDPAAGEVSLAGRPLTTIAPDEVRRGVGLVDDAPYVFATTVAENVRLARPGATDAEVLDALHRARLGPWLATLPDGLGTWLGDGHAAVSGGERARLGIARSLLADHPVLVLDEPAAHLDHATAQALAEEVLLGTPARAVLWITHTPVGLDLVDRTVALGEAALGTRLA